MHVFCLTRGPTRSWRNGDAQCCQLNNISDPFSNFFSFKKVPEPYIVSENCRYCCASERSCFHSARWTETEQTDAERERERCVSAEPSWRTEREREREREREVCARCESKTSRSRSSTGNSQRLYKVRALFWRKKTSLSLSLRLSAQFPFRELRCVSFTLRERFAW